MSILNPEEFRLAIQDIVALAPTAAVLQKAANLIKDPNTELAPICELLKTDGPLAADIIRISNSAFYAAAVPHGSLNSAVSYLGLREVIRVVNLSLARQLFARDLSSYGISAKDYWSSSVAAALVMEALAQRITLNQEDAYMIGIMHAIGRVLINRILQERGYAIRWDGHQPVEEWERNAVGFDFAETGAILTDDWHFPLEMCEVIRWQLDPAKVSNQLSCLGALQFTKRLLDLTGTDFTQRGWHVPETDPFVRAAGLTPTSIDHIVAGCEDSFNGIRQSVDF